MPFVNEYIPEEDYEKYDLRRICGEHNLKSSRGRMYSNDWTIDRERDAFLIQVWYHNESRFMGWAFYWKGEWLFFEMATKEAKRNKDDNTFWALYHIRKFKINDDLNERKDEIIADLRSALSEYSGGGVLYDFKQRTATVEFIEE